MTRTAIMSKTNLLFLIKSMGFCSQEPVFYDISEVDGFLDMDDILVTPNSYDGAMYRMKCMDKDYMWDQETRVHLLSFESRYAFRTGGLDREQKQIAAKILGNDQIKAFSSYWGLDSEEDAMLLKIAANLTVLELDTIRAHIQANPIYTL